MFEEVKQILDDALQLGARVNDLTVETPLLGSIPEFDSMTVVVVLTSIEDRLGIVIEDDDISADTFATVGTLLEFVEERLAV